MELQNCTTAAACCRCSLAVLLGIASLWPLLDVVPCCCCLPPRNLLAPRPRISSTRHQKQKRRELSDREDSGWQEELGTETRCTWRNQGSREMGDEAEYLQTRWKRGGCSPASQAAAAAALVVEEEQHAVLEVGAEESAVRGLQDGGDKR